MAVKKHPGYRNTVMNVLGIEVDQAGPDLVVMAMPVDARTCRPNGLLHGGACAVLAETAASEGTFHNLDRKKQGMAGLEINVSYLRPKRSGFVRAIAAPLHKGRSTMVWDIKIADEQENIVCVSRCTMAIIDMGS
jgi:uncharacterized protein (TIGR00369 family)